MHKKFCMSSPRNFEMWRIVDLIFCCNSNSRGSNPRCHSMASCFLLVFFCSPTTSDIFADTQWNPFKELGLEIGAPQSSIRSAFIRLAKEHHPDKNHGKSQDDERFKRVRRAYETLISSSQPETKLFETHASRNPENTATGEFRRGIPICTT